MNIVLMSLQEKVERLITHTIKGPLDISMDSLAYPTQVWLTLVFRTPFRDMLMMLLLGYFGSD